MKFKTAHFFCSPRLLQTVSEIREIYSCMDRVRWKEEFKVEINGEEYGHQRGYNKAFPIGSNDPP